MSDYAGVLNIVVAVGCLTVIVAATYRTETMFLRVAMVFTLGLEVAERAVVGYLRLQGSSEDALEPALYILIPLRTALAVCMFVLAAAIFSLDRTGEDSTGEEDQ